MIKKDLYAPNEFKFCVNHGFNCIMCCHHNARTNSCSKIKTRTSTSTSLPKKEKKKDKLVLTTVDDYKRAFDVLSAQGHGNKEVCFGYDTDFVYTGDYKVANISIKEDRVEFNETYPD